MWRLVVACGLLVAVGLMPAGRAQAASMGAFLQVYDLVRSEYLNPTDEAQLEAAALKGLLGHAGREHELPRYLEQARSENRRWATFRAAFEDAQAAGGTKDEKALEYAAIRGLLDSLDDPYTRFMEPKVFRSMQSERQGSFYGIGIQIGMSKDKRLSVIAPFENAPAARAGVRSGDLILEIDGRDTMGMAIEEAVSHLRGPKGVKVVLKIQRGQRDPFDVTIVRDAILTKAVKTRDLNGNIGYIRLSTLMSENADQEMRQALERFKGKSGLVLDLRGNPGGLLPNAVNIASMLIDSGPIVQTLDRDGQREQLTATGRLAYPKNKPVVVLVDGGSAASTEILSGALQDTRRAVLVGTKTFGKGLIQTVHALEDGSGVAITTNKYLTANGRDINEKGVVPDVVVTLPSVPEDEQVTLEQLIASGTDNQLLAAVEYLQDGTAPAVLARKYDRAIRQAAAPKVPPQLALEVAFHDPTGHQALEAEGRSVLRIRAKNVGKGPATRVKAQLSQERPMQGLILPKSVEVGDLAPGAEQEVSVPLSATRHLATGRCGIEINLVDAHDYDAPPVRLSFETRSFVPPRLVVQQVGVEDGSKDGVLKPGEQLDLAIVVANRGGTARDVKARLLIDHALIKLNDSDQASLGTLAPGEWREATFSVFVANRYNGPADLPLRLELVEAHPDLSIKHPLRITLHQAGPSYVDEVVTAKPSGRLPDIEPPDKSIDVDRIPTGRNRNPDAFAVVIGIEQYGGEVPAVPYARRDAGIFREYLVKTFGVPEENIEYLLDERATLGNIRTALEGKLMRAVEPERSDVFVYFAGHGAPDPGTNMPYLIPFDGHPSFPATSCYPLASAYSALGQLGARSVTVVLDSCFSGAAGRTTSPQTLIAGARPLVLQTKTVPVPPAITVFAAASADQISSSYDQKKHGLFTYFFLKGLQGAALRGGDKVLTPAKLQAYLEEQVPRAARRLNREQSPVLLGGGAERELLICD